MTFNYIFNIIKHIYHFSKYYHLKFQSPTLIPNVHKNRKKLHKIIYNLLPYSMIIHNIYSRIYYITNYMYWINSIYFVCLQETIF